MVDDRAGTSPEIATQSSVSYQAEPMEQSEAVQTKDSEALDPGPSSRKIISTGGQPNTVASSYVFDSSTNPKEIFEKAAACPLEKFVNERSNILILTCGAPTNPILMGESSKPGLLPRTFHYLFKNHHFKKPSTAMIPFNHNEAREVRLPEIPSLHAVKAKLLKKMPRTGFDLEITPYQVISVPKLDRRLVPLHTASLWLTAYIVSDGMVFDLLDEFDPKREPSSHGRDSAGNTYIKDLRQVNIISSSEALRVIQVASMTMRKLKAKKNPTDSKLVVTIKMISQITNRKPEVNQLVFIDFEETQNLNILEFHRSRNSPDQKESRSARTSGIVTSPQGNSMAVRNFCFSPSSESSADEAREENSQKKPKSSLMKQLVDAQLSSGCSVSLIMCRDSEAGNQGGMERRQSSRKVAQVGRNVSSSRMSRSGIVQTSKKTGKWEVMPRRSLKRLGGTLGVRKSCGRRASSVNRALTNRISRRVMTQKVPHGQNLLGGLNVEDVESLKKVCEENMVYARVGVPHSEKMRADMKLMEMKSKGETLKGKSGMKRGKSLGNGIGNVLGNRKKGKLQEVRTKPWRSSSRRTDSQANIRVTPSKESMNEEDVGAKGETNGSLKKDIGKENKVSDEDSAKYKEDYIKLSKYLQDTILPELNSLREQSQKVNDVGDGTAKGDQDELAVSGEPNQGVVPAGMFVQKGGNSPEDLKLLEQVVTDFRRECDLWRNPLYLGDSDKTDRDAEGNDIQNGNSSSENIGALKAIREFVTAELTQLRRKAVEHDREVLKFDALLKEYRENFFPLSEKKSLEMTKIKLEAEITSYQRQMKALQKENENLRIQVKHGEALQNMNDPDVELVPIRSPQRKRSVEFKSPKKNPPSTAAVGKRRRRIRLQNEDECILDETLHESIKDTSPRSNLSRPAKIFK